MILVDDKDATNIDENLLYSGEQRWRQQKKILIKVRKVLNLKVKDLELSIKSNRLAYVLHIQ